MDENGLMQGHLFPAMLQVGRTRSDGETPLLVLHYLTSLSSFFCRRWLLPSTSSRTSQSDSLIWNLWYYGWPRFFDPCLLALERHRGVSLPYLEKLILDFDPSIVRYYRIASIATIVEVSHGILRKTLQRMWKLQSQEAESRFESTDREKPSSMLTEHSAIRRDLVVANAGEQVALAWAIETSTIWCSGMKPRKPKAKP